MTTKKINVYEMVTNRIIEELEKGNVPWRKSWKSHIDNGNLAYNRITKKPYSLLNQMLLSRGGSYASFRQWQNLGGRIKKGAKSEFVVFWKMLKVEEVNKETGETEEIVIPFLKYNRVFHISQVTGVEPLNKEELDTTQVPQNIEDAETVIADYLNREKELIFNSTITDKAYYSPLTDMVQVPQLSQYDNASEYYSTTFHELIHSTGHISRLNRFKDNKSARFGSQTYSKEELVAEIGSAMILNVLNVENTNTFNNSVSYIQGWLKVLKNDNKFIVSASSKAERAVKLILNIN